MSPPLSWNADDSEAERLAEAPVQFKELMLSIWESGDPTLIEEWLEFHEWTLSERGRSDLVGASVSNCAARYEAQLSDRCMWTTVFVVRRTDEIAGAVRHASTRMVRGEEQAACVALASCVLAAVATNPERVPMPSILGDLLAIEIPGRGAMWHEGERLDHIEHYKRLADETRSWLEGAPKADGLDAIARIGHAQNDLFNRYRLRETERMIELLKR